MFLFVCTGECSAHVGNAGNCSRVESKCCLSTVPTTTYRPYSIGCFRGCPLDRAIDRNGERVTDLGSYASCRLSGQPGTVEDYVPQSAAAVQAVYAPSNEQISVPDDEEGSLEDTLLPGQSACRSAFSSNLQYIAVFWKITSFCSFFFPVSYDLSCVGHLDESPLGHHAQRV